MNNMDRTLVELEQLAAELKAAKEVRESWISSGGMGDRVTGIRVIRDDQIIQENIT